jgi:hypothetical protein
MAATMNARVEAADRVTGADQGARDFVVTLAVVVVTVHHDHHRCTVVFSAAIAAAMCPKRSRARARCTVELTGV